MTEKNILDDEYEKSVESYQYYVFKDPENLQKNSQKYEKSYDSSSHDYNDINNVYFVNKRVEHLCNKCDISFLSKNKLFNHLRKTYRKFKTIIKTLDTDFQTIIFMINNAKVIIIHFIVELRDAIVKPSYNFRN